MKYFTYLILLITTAFPGVHLIFFGYGVRALWLFDTPGGVIEELDQEWGRGGGVASSGT